LAGRLLLATERIAGVVLLGPAPLAALPQGTLIPLVSGGD